MLSGPTQYRLSMIIAPERKLVPCAQGLGFPQLSKQGVQPPFFSLMVQEVIPAPQFSMWLNPDRDSPQGGTLLLGGIDRTQYSGQLVTLPLSLQANG